MRASGMVVGLLAAWRTAAAAPCQRSQADQAVLADAIVAATASNVTTAKEGQRKRLRAEYLVQPEGWVVGSGGGTVTVEVSCLDTKVSRAERGQPSAASHCSAGPLQLPGVHARTHDLAPVALFLVAGGSADGQPLYAPVPTVGAGDCHAGAAPKQDSLVESLRALLATEGVAKGRAARTVPAAQTPEPSDLADAQAALRKGQNAAALKLGQAILDKAPSNREARLVVASAACGLKDAATATRAMAPLDDAAKTAIRQICMRSGVTLK